MSARRLVRILVVALVLSPVCASAQIYWFDPHPDLAPVNISVGADCAIFVSLTNNGPGVVPSSGYAGPATGIQMYVDGSPWGGIALGLLDTAHLTAPVGGTVTAPWFPNLPLPPGTHSVTLQVDNNNSVVESNEANNVMTRPLTCQPPAPDLAPVSLTVNSQCELVVTLRNVGTGPIPDLNFAPTGANSSAIQMYNDGQPFGGISLGGLDPSRQVQSAGGAVTYTWFPGLKINGGPHVVTVVADNNNSIAELDEANNSLTQTLTCFRIIHPPVADPPIGNK